MNVENFILKYPISLKEVISSPIIFRGNAFEGFDLPWPSMAHLRDLSEFAGFSYGALRTALSRAVAANEILSFQDDKGKTRFKISEFQKDISESVREHSKRQPGLTIAVFSFKTEEEKKRSSMRQLLHWYGFRMLSQNVYVTGALNLERIQSSMNEAGLSDHIYLFFSPGPGTDITLEKLKEIFEVELHCNKSIEFLKDMKGFIEGDMPSGEFARRAFYLGPVHHGFSFTNDIPLHESLLPDDYPKDELSGALTKILVPRIGDLVSYYMSFE